MNTRPSRRCRELTKLSTVTRIPLRPSLSIRTRSLSRKAMQRRATRHTSARNFDSVLNNSTDMLSKPDWSDTVDACRFSTIDNGSKLALPQLENSYVNNDSPLSYLAQSEGNGCTQTPSSASSISSTDSNVTSACKWENCNGIIVEKAQLINHIHQAHVLPQLLSNRRRYYFCLWRGCRVFKQPSVSAAWLEQHTLHHTEAKGKPFRCIFDSCSLRFSTSILLERHVQRAHMRMTRALTNKIVPFAEALPGINDSLRSGTTAVGDKVNSCPVSNIKKSTRKKRRIRWYRVRRVDFYDARSRCVIKNRLNLLRMLSNNDGNNLLDSAQRSTNNQWSLPLPKPLNNIQSKHRLRSLPCRAPRPADDTSSDDSESPLNTLDRRRHVALLMTTPHTIVGQRLSENQRTEFLVQWVGEPGIKCISPTWILESDLRAAAVLAEM